VEAEVGALIGVERRRWFTLLYTSVQNNARREGGKAMCQGPQLGGHRKEAKNPTPYPLDFNDTPGWIFLLFFLIIILT
jgi:hypothetical protein